MANCVRLEKKGITASCFFPKWINNGECEAPKGKWCPKPNFIIAKSFDQRTPGERAVDDFLAENRSFRSGDGPSRIAGALVKNRRL